MQIGLGPVFAYEWLTTSRKWQVYALRSGFVIVLLIGMVSVWASELAGRRVPETLKGMAEVGKVFYNTVTILQLVLVLLAAPAATAGAICVDKARGTLMHVLMTDLSDSEIVLGKLAARLTPVIGLVACALPVAALGTLMGGIDPVQLACAFMITLGTAILACTIAFTISVWGTKVHEVLTATYLILAAWLAGPPIALEMLSTMTTIRPQAQDWLIPTNPFVLAIEPVVRMPWAATALSIAYFAGTLALSAGLAWLATARLRPVALRQASRAQRPPRRWRLSRPAWWPRGIRWSFVPGPSLDGNPVLWREWHHHRPSRWGRVVWAFYVAGSLAIALYVILGALAGDRRSVDSGSAFNGLVAAFGLLLLSVSSASALAEERNRGSLDVLLSTPLSTAQIVWGKWFGTYRTVPRLAILPTLMIASMTPRTGFYAAPVLVALLILAYGAAITSLGLFLATWIKRQGRAISIAVAAVVVMTVGLVVLAFLMLRRAGDAHVSAVACASPFWGVGFFSALTGDVGGPREFLPYVAAWNVFWTMAYFSAAGLLYLLTLATFDDRLGRTQVTTNPPAPPKSAIKPEKAALASDLVEV